MLAYFNVQKTHYFLNTVGPLYPASLKRFCPSFRQSTVCSDWPTGTLHCDWLNTTQAPVGNVTPLSIIRSFSLQIQFKDS